MNILDWNIEKKKNIKEMLNEWIRRQKNLKI